MRLDAAMPASDPEPLRSPGYQRKGGWGRSLLIALITGIVGFVTSAFAANLAIEWYQVPAYEGTGIFFVAPFAFLGLLAGCVAGLIGSLLSRRTGVPIARAFQASVGAILVLVATTAFAAWVLADIPPEIAGRQLFLAVELRTPAGSRSPAGMPGVGYVKLGATIGSRIRRQVTGPLFVEDTRAEDGRWIVPGAVHVFTSRGGRAIDIGIGDAPLASFALPLPAHPPAESRAWSEWLPQPGAVPRPDVFTFRYKVVPLGEELRVQSFGRFRVETIVESFYAPRGSQRIAATSHFRISYDNQPLPGFERSAYVALLGAPGVTLLAQEERFHGRCYVMTENGAAAQARPIGECRAPIAGRPLTSDPGRFAAARDEGFVLGWVDQLTFRTPGLFQVHHTILDTRTLTSSTFDAPSSFPSSGLPPPLGISPDERSFVWFSHDGSTDRPRLGVTDWKANRSYILPIDRDRMRFIGFETLDPGWVSHHFAWRRDSRGVDILEARTDFVPLPYRGHLDLGKPGEAQGYLLLPAGEPLRKEVIRMLVEELHGERLSDHRDGTQRVRLKGKVLNVRVGLELVSVTMDFGQGDPELLERVAAHLDAAVGSGKYDALFRAPAHYHPP
jgi:hypothetical protein